MVAESGPDLLWVLFLAWVVHDAEEFLVGPGWLARNQERLERRSEESPAIERFVAVIVADRVAFAVELAIIGSFVLGATVLGYLDPTGPGILVYVTILGGFALHVVIHLAQSVAFQGYAPGLVTGVLVVVPASGVLYSEVLSSGLVAGWIAVVTAVVGLAIVVPTALWAQRVGHRVSARVDV